MKMCPKCGRLLSYNSYFGAYICEMCNWEDASRGRRRNVCCSNQSILAELSRNVGKGKKLSIAR